MKKASRLAILGGDPVRRLPFPVYNAIGREERRNVDRVMRSGVLSSFVGAWGPGFQGGPWVQRLEKSWARKVGARFAVSVNSATSGLYAALGAAGVGPGDEVIVPPYTMSASAAGALIYGAVPVFADVDRRTYCLTAETIRPRLTARTKAVVAVDLFGHPADFDGIMRLARERRLVVIEDAAQAPGARYKGRWAGTLGHMGVFSLNYHKTIHCGEGGVVMTDDARLAERLSLIRNHGEAVVGPKGALEHADIVGFNYRLTELQAAVTCAQLEKLERLTAPRIEAADFLRERWSRIPGLTPAVVEKGCRHVYYVFAVQCDADLLGLSRARFVEAVAAEGVRLIPGYAEPLYRQPLYRKRLLRSGPNDARYAGEASYADGLCPVAEEMHRERLFYTTLVHAGLSKKDLRDVALAVEKVADGAAELVRRERR